MSVFLLQEEEEVLKRKSEGDEEQRGMRKKRSCTRETSLLRKRGLVLWTLAHALSLSHAGMPICALDQSLAP
jgi:hypothetical protein